VVGAPQGSESFGGDFSVTRKGVVDVDEQGTCFDARKRVHVA
jgi:hypothetical protein